MRWLHSEYLLKGIFWGLVLAIGLQEPTLATSLGVAVCLLGGLAVGVAAGAWSRLREGTRINGRPLVFLLFVLLESPTAVYAGVLLGLGLGAASVPPPTEPLANLPDRDRLLLGLVLGGAALGALFGAIRQLRPARARLIAGGVAATVGVAAGVWWVGDPAELLDAHRTLGLHLLLGLPFFYLLTFVGENEETEVEAALWCAGLALGVWLIRFPAQVPQLGLLLPLTLYVVYALRILPGLRVFKHALRGYSYLRLGRLPLALRSFRRALQLDPHNRLAREGLWELHRNLDLERLTADPEILPLIDLDMCLDRASGLLLGDTPPTADDRAEAERLCTLVEARRPDLAAQVEYLRVVSATHAKEFDRAAQILEHLLDPHAWPATDPVRAVTLVSAWTLALLAHPELVRRLGSQHLALPGRRLELIDALESNREQPAGLKQQVYRDLTPAEFDARRPEQAFDYVCARDEGLGMLAANQLERATDLLRIAAQGLPDQAPALWVTLADAYTTVGQTDAARSALRAARVAGLTVGHQQLGQAARETFFSAIKRLADDAVQQRERDAAIDYFHLYTEYEKSGIETLRTLADLYQQDGKLLNALRVTEEALLYNSSDKDLVARKEQYYASIDPDAVAQLPENVRKSLDVAYCLRVGKQTLDRAGGDPELFAWGQQLARVAYALRPDSLAAQLLMARALLRQGERDEALRRLEDIREAKPSGADEQDAWYRCCQLLGDLYLQEFARPDLAVACLKDFKPCPFSGADTDFRLGQAYESLGDKPRALRAYEQVTIYTNHPLYYDATQAVRRLKESV